MSKLIKRKDGSYSKRGLWDNIRANKGSGKEPTKEMLKQESKIKKEENMKSMYKKGGKKMKGESFMEESKEIDFQAPGVKPPKKYLDGGPKSEKTESGYYRQSTRTMNDGTTGYNRPVRTVKGVLAGAASVDKAAENRKSSLYTNPPVSSRKEAPTAKEEKQYEKFKAKTYGDFKDMTSAAYIPDENKPVENKPLSRKKGGMIETGMEANARQNQAEGKATMAGKKKVYKTGGAKTMEPGGGGRFAAMVGKLKSKGKSEESAEAIAASAGRKKYGKSKFQSMAAAGKKKMMGGKKC